MDKTAIDHEELFIIYAPCGLPYLPPVPLEEARAEIAARSLFPGESGWQIVPVESAIDKDGQIRRKRELLITTGGFKR